MRSSIKITAALLLFSSLIVAPAIWAKDKSENGVFRPTLANNAKKYLRQFPIGKARADEVLQYVGTPDKTFSMSGSDFLTYSIAAKGASGVIEYTYEVKDGIVVNATYLNSGNFFGVTQRESAKQLQDTESEE